VPRPDKRIVPGPDLNAPTTASRANSWTKYGGPETIDGRGAPSQIEVTVDEITVLVSVALGTQDIAACTPGDRDGDQSITVDELLDEEGFDAVFIGTGAGLPYFMNIPGENLNGIYSANEYLTRANLMKAYLFPEADTPVTKGKHVAVVGGGNVAMDAARTARRMGAEKVYVVYRRSKKEMPARIEEIHHAEEEGIEFHLLTNPLRFLGNEEAWVTEAECQRMELGEPDASGRRRPVPVKGSEFRLAVDTVVMSIGNGANPLVPATTPGLDTNKWGNILADQETGKTSKKGVFAGGDIVIGAATVILAMGAGRKAADAIHEYIKTGVW